jgi:hypothetical protein
VAVAHAHDVNRLATLVDDLDVGVLIDDLNAGVLVAWPVVQQPWRCPGLRAWQPLRALWGASVVDVDEVLVLLHCHRF